MKIHDLVSSFLALALTVPALSGETASYGQGGTAAEKSSYNLFNPTPRELMRELSPDRPDATESPLTVDAGRFVVELSWFDWRRNDDDEAYTVMATNLKLGLNHRTDLQLVFDAYSWDEPDAGPAEEGFGDIQLRLKYNLWGNDEGESALALFPYVKLPTGADLSNDEWEVGLIVPYGTELWDGIGLGLMAELDWIYDGDEEDHELEFLHSVVLGFDLTGKAGLFIEYIGIEGDDHYQAYGAGGLTYSVNEDLVLDCGTQVGINNAAEDIGLFAGMTKRF